ncbi:PD-(D/E)XK nuclease family protein [Aureibacter tunicatorum]|uniref:CRISPR/Cas system-associated exonuclease Cas4 (RecB family) n=1 Tax=Aureibacter tunicatorum TaxID=866807 RepID=A0AAE4BTR9_9BACT|nr:PD-(D/E)XK nuclease family protein [Aureibacter tunicatorum]MDR6240250.1 CRISPR/Cas system-associated exonuclease Cas4 (RecB family) [Aureibacter tunicatorum]BDD05869.1 hypothetical protein AUTU_33520 [Aureibacter tunicatorum]
MKTFLAELASYVHEQYGAELENLTIVFPNRRAGLFFRKELAQVIDQPIWSPEIISMDDFIKSMSSLQACHKLKLSLELHKAYQKHSKGKEPFDKFYYWGEVLLRDFEDIDKYAGSANKIFETLKDQKLIEQEFDYLEEEQIALIKSFWKSFGEKRSKHQEDFVETWKILANVYKDFQESLKEQGLGYTGMIHRDLIAKLHDEEFTSPYTKLLFAGFNALTVTEENIITWFCKNTSTEIIWDADNYYVSSTDQEAGNFLRQYKRHKILGDTFPKSFESNFIDQEKDITYIGVAKGIGQTKWVGENLKNYISSTSNFVEENTAIVLPDENLLFPMLHSLPESIKKVNVTMGYPLKNTALYGFFMHLLDLQQTKSKEGKFKYRAVLSILKHPYVLQNEHEKITSIINHIIENNITQVDPSTFQGLQAEAIFKPTKNIDEFCKYLVEVLILVNKNLESNFKGDSNLEQEVIFRFYTELNKLHELFRNEGDVKVGFGTFVNLLKQVIMNIRIPFAGEPLEGIQLMGVLETRNLDFENLYILSVNETSFPAAPNTQSFIPYNLRKGFGLPTFEQADAMYAYLFYRILQRAKKITILYDTEQSGGKGGEMSRFLYQLIYEHPNRKDIKRKVLSNSAVLKENLPISIQRTTPDRLDKYLGSSGKILSPSAINTYLDCPLKFYFRYIANIKEPSIIKEEVDPMIFGNILHHVMETLYSQLINRKNNPEITQTDFDFLRKNIDSALENGFRKFFDIDNNESFVFEGRNTIIKSIIKKMTNKILDIDASYAPFEIVGMEYGVENGNSKQIEINVNETKQNIRIGGTIDRIDLKDGVLRVIDYKSGKDEKKIHSLESLFDPDFSMRNKAGFQTLLYADIFNFNNSTIGKKIEIGVYNSKGIFNDTFDPRFEISQNKKNLKIEDCRSLLQEFDEQLQKLLEEIFNPRTIFKQTTKVERCQFCPYNVNCKR